ncbi:MAG TPA: hypothetical protein VFE65_35625 [Pseudonocardia sp.]|jgi:hypothetical protein|nr:hypothetical protein [Pseudonocardia sp.]
MIGPEVPVGPDVTAVGVDTDSDGRPDTAAVARLASPTVVVDLDRDGRADVMIEVRAAGDTRTTPLDGVGTDWLWATQQPVAPDPGFDYWSDPDPDPPDHDVEPQLGPDADGGPLDLVDCLLDLFS